MSLNFKPQHGSAIDLDTGLTIYSPRMLPASSPEDPTHIEYQYSLRRNNQSVYGLGIFGESMKINTEHGQEYLFTFDLGRRWVLDSIFKLKNIINNEDEKLSFLKNLAHGLLLVSQSDAAYDQGVRYVALTDVTLLKQNGIEILENIKIINSTKVVLAEIFIPAS